MKQKQFEAQAKEISGQINPFYHILKLTTFLETKNIKL